VNTVDFDPISDFRFAVSNFLSFGVRGLDKDVIPSRLYVIRGGLAS